MSAESCMAMALYLVCIQYLFVCTYAFLHKSKRRELSYGIWYICWSWSIVVLGVGSRWSKGIKFDRWLTRGLTTFPNVDPIQEPLLVRYRDGRPNRTPWWCAASVCIGSALLGDLLGISRSTERDLSVLSIYPRIILRVFIVYRLLLGFLAVLLYSTRLFMCVSCFGSAVSRPTCQAIDYKDSFDDTFTWWGDYLHKAQVEEIVSVHFFFHLVCLCCYVFFSGPTQYVFHTSVAQYSPFVLKVPLNTDKPNQLRLKLRWRDCKIVGCELHEYLPALSLTFCAWPVLADVLVGFYHVFQAAVCGLNAVCCKIVQRCFRHLTAFSVFEREEFICRVKCFGRCSTINI